MARQRRRSAQIVQLDPLRRRCARLRRRGEHRKAALALRELVFRDGTAGAWVRLGAALVLAGRTAQAVDALKQGAYLHRRAGAQRRAAVVHKLIAAARAGQSLRGAA